MLRVTCLVAFVFNVLCASKSLLESEMRKLVDLRLLSCNGEFEELESVENDQSWRSRLSHINDNVILELSCSELYYVSLVDDIHSKHGGSAGFRLPKIAEFPEKQNFFSIFEDFVVEGRPFLGHFSSEKSLFPSESSSVLVPSVAINNYIWRNNNNSWGEYFDSGVTAPISVFAETMTSTLYRCPLGMNQVIWPVGTPSDSATVRLFSAFDRSNFESSLHLYHLHEESYISTGFEDPSIVPTLPRFRETSLSPSKYLYIPNSQLVSWNWASKSFDSRMIRACIVDASNVNLFRSRIKQFLPIFPSFRSLHDRISGLSDLSMLRNPDDMTLSDILTFDFQSAGSSLTASSGVSEGAKTTTGAKNRRKRQSSSSGIREWQDNLRWNSLISSLCLSPPTVLSADSLTRHSAIIHIDSAVFLPKTNDESIFGFNFSVCLQKDMMTCQFFVAYKNIDPEVPKSQVIELNTTLLRDSLYENVSYSQFFSAKLKNLEPSTDYRISVATIYQTFQSLFSESFVSIETLPVTVPSPVSCFPSEDRSRYCIEAIPSMDDLSVIVEFQGLEDEGGSPLLGYHILANIVDEKHMMTERFLFATILPEEAALVSVHGPRRFTLNHLFPNVTYQFHMLPYNKIGNASSLSLPSNPITVHIQTSQASSSRRNLLLGRSHIKHTFSSRFLPTLLWNYPTVMESSSNSVESDRSVMLLLSDIDEMLTYGSRSLAVWTAFHSPRMYDVEGDCYYVDSYHAESDTITNNNVGDLHGYILMINRDGITPLGTLATSMQSRGASAVIILDNGSCKDYDQSCLPGSSKSRHEYFGRFDIPLIWKYLKIPVVFATQDIGRDLLASHVCRSVSGSNTFQTNDEL